MTNKLSAEESCGSVWHRWDPHIHTPGTILNDQYGGADPWQTFLSQVESSQPQIRALGITDYLSIEQYEQALFHKNSGRIANVGLIFPNVEMRFGIETSKGSGVNVHLLFSPDTPDHVEQIKRILERLNFRYLHESYRCCRADLISLGRKHQPQAEDDQAALAVGVNQFKVSFEQLQAVWESSEWIRKNCLVAVAAGERDGTSGLRDSSDSFSALRKSIEAFAHIIFSSNASQIEFWLGRRSATLEDLESKWGGMKPCLHGSDAHVMGRVGVPDAQRLCWIKGDLTFESLRQACIEPESRVHIGAQSPRGSLAGHTIQSVRVSNALWMIPANIPLNPGLIAIIGARGSGKTALADLIAAGGFAVSSRLNPKSFVVRAREHLGDSRSELSWEHGEITGNDLKQIDVEDLLDTPRVQYLSQQFVENLCSAEGLANSLVEEIERVIFNAHPVDEREGASSFNDLYVLQSAAAVECRTRHEQEFVSASSALTQERHLKQELPLLMKQRAELAKQIGQDQKDRGVLIGKGQDARARRHEELVDALEMRRRGLEVAQARLRTLNALLEDVLDIKVRQAPAWLAELQNVRSDAALEQSEWDQFKLAFVGDVDLILHNHSKKAEDECKRIAGTVPTSTEPEVGFDPNVQLIADNANLSEVTIALLQQEVARLGKLIGMDAQNAKRFAALNEKISKANKTLEKFDAKIAKANNSDRRIQELIQLRLDAYAGVFGAIVDLETQLKLLYAPLAKQLSSSSGTLGKLGFAVRRQVDIEQWAAKGEALLDLRRIGPFKGRGALLDTATKILFGPWQSGSPRDVSAAIMEFIQENEASLRAHKPEAEDNREWVSSVSKWLHSTNHIEIAYGVQYDGVDIELLSPGTRGIVLLLLYLAIDEEDDRPLIIDQPEENLDPQSIFDELVSRFRLAKNRRQIIIVTHNANLVVNTDADQVIVATAGQHRPGELPQITYESGGLENPHIRKRVCDILEGGERAFRARAKRLRLGINESPVQQVAVSCSSK
ncbi:TrlF family AAA-like ATPase [Candidatus Nitrotoga sp. BS]|uniref:TrlF family AAA-like ATPase n=1 Tax=Candidatus Nitrotoga sp. BS TaxID=2890408 RepID=UPI001EF3C307|nr:AAA family ATPase [Candidatus Nitrotoga sp. BS]